MEFVSVLLSCIRWLLPKAMAMLIPPDGGNSVSHSQAVMGRPRNHILPRPGHSEAGISEQNKELVGKSAVCFSCYNFKWNRKVEIVLLSVSPLLPCHKALNRQLCSSVLP